MVNGNADSLSCNCYQLTQAVNTQAGSVWNSNEISLNDPFDFTFDVFLGNNNGGADGIAFVLQPISTAAGSTGGGMGYQGIDPSLAIEIDTYQNGWDPSNDHMAIQYNGVVDHGAINNLAGPVDALSGGGDIEDGQWHLLRVVWNPVSLTLDAYMDGVFRISYTGDVVTDIFSSDPMVFWGFTGSTGGLNNDHRFCLSILPNATVNANSICAGESVNFTDSSYSALGDVVSWDWDFGNGQNSSIENPGQITYPDPGDYYVVQTIVDAAGCGATDSLEIQVNPNPVADFTGTDVCEGDETSFINQSTVTSGSISEWSWDLGDGNTANTTNTQNVYATSGDYDIALLVETGFGCVDSTIGTVSVFENPTANATHEAQSLTVDFITDLLSGEQVMWFIEDTSFTNISTVNYTFPDSGTYQVLVVTTNENGCIDSLWYSLYVEGVPEYEVANVFTPNGDDFNEVFQPETYAISESDFKVYNRWGRPVYKFEGSIVDQGLIWGWDGKVNGKADAAEGTYYYILSMKGLDGNNYKEQGTVTLVR